MPRGALKTEELAHDLYAGFPQQDSSLSLSFSTCKVELLIVANPKEQFEGLIQIVHRRHLEEFQAHNRSSVNTANYYRGSTINVCIVESHCRLRREARVTKMIDSVPDETSESFNNEVTGNSSHKEGERG